MSRLPSLRALLKRSAAAADPVEAAQDRDVALAAVATAEAAVAAAGQAYEDALLVENDANLRALDEGRRTAAIRLDQARALLGRLEAGLAEAQAEARRAEVASLVQAADDAQAAFQAATVELLPRMGADARRLVRLRAEAQLAGEAAAAALAADGERPAGRVVEDFRTLRGRPRRELSPETEVELWVQGNGTPYGESYQAQIRTHHDGSGHLPHTGSATYADSRLTLKRRFRRSEYLPAERDQHPEDLVSALQIPGLRFGDQPGWTPLRDDRPRAVLAALDRLERQVDREGDSRQPKVDLVALGPAYHTADPLTARERMVERIAESSPNRLARAR